MLANRAIKKNVNIKAQNSVHERTSVSKSKTLEMWYKTSGETGGVYIDPEDERVKS